MPISLGNGQNRYKVSSVRHSRLQWQNHSVKRSRPETDLLTILSFFCRCRCGAHINKCCGASSTKQYQARLLWPREEVDLFANRHVHDVVECMHVYIWMWFVVIKFGWGVGAWNQITAQEEISKAKISHFSVQSLSYGIQSRTLEIGKPEWLKEVKRRRDDRRSASHVEENLVWKLIPYFFYFTKATKLISLWKFLLYSKPITFGNELRIYDMIP